MSEPSQATGEGGLWGLGVPELVTRRDNGYRELWSGGGHNVRLCQLGRARLDGRLGFQG